MDIIKSIISFTGSVLILCSCTEREYIDIYDSSDEADVYTIVHNDIIAQTFKHLELAEVFSGYQDIRSDRETAKAYVEKYFYASRLFYEMMHVDNWGTITLEPDGSFISETWHWRRFWIMLGMEQKVHITAPEEHVYSFSSISDTGTWTCTGEIVDNVVTISELTFAFKDKSGGYARVDLLSPVTSPMCKNRKRKNEPISGSIQIIYTSDVMGEEFTRRFTVTFHEKGKTLTLQDGVIRELGPETNYNQFCEY